MTHEYQGIQRDWAVLLLAHGSPEKVEDIPEYLLKVRGGKPLPEPAVREIVRRYELIGGGSPLRCWTEKQTMMLRERLQAPVAFGMRNWKPYIAEAVAGLPRGVKNLVVVCLAPQNSRTSIGLYREHLNRALETSPPIEVAFIESWHDHPKLIEAFAEKLRAGLAAAKTEFASEPPVILTAHSVPESTIAAGDPYEQQARETAAMVAAAAGVTDWRMAFQSQGMTREPWIGPTVESQIDELAAQKHRTVFIAPVGFLCDHAEILYDIDIQFREYARSKGMELRRSESLNDSGLLTEALAALVEGRR